ncbi:MAG: hypothetical protein ACC660_01660, partial [Acidimicrobiales bacterium]
MTIVRLIGRGAVRALLIVALLTALGLPAQAQKDKEQATSSACGGGSADTPTTRSTDSKKTDSKKKSTPDQKKNKGKGKSKNKNSEGGDKKPAKCKPPPPQVSLTNVASPATAATDLDLQAALADAGFLDTWYGATPTNPRLSLLVVTGAGAEAGRAALLDQAQELVQTRDTVAQLQSAKDESIDQREAILGDVVRAEDRIAGLGVERGRAQATLTTLRGGLDEVVGALQDTAVGMYMGAQQSNVTGVDDVDNYNVQRELAERVDLTIDELLAQRDDLETRIASGVTRLSEIDDAIAVQRGARDELVRREQNIQATIDRLANNITDLTRRRIEIETQLPDA